MNIEIGVTKMADPHVTAPATTLIPPDDKDIPLSERNRVTRIVSVVVITLLSMLAPTLLGNSIGSLFNPHLGWLLGLGGFVVGGNFLSRIAKRLFVYNGEWMAYVTNDPFGGKNVPYGPGLHFSHLWEQRNKESEYDLGVITVPFTSPAQTSTSNVRVTGSFQYRIDLEYITRFIGLKPSTIQEGLVAFVKSFLTEELSKRDTEGARKNLGEINTALKTKFVDQAHEIETKYGIETVNLFLEAITVPEDVQKTRDAVDEADQLMKIVAKISGLSVQEYEERRKQGLITHQEHKEFLDRAMAASGNRAQINVNTFEGGNGKVTPMVQLPTNQA